MGFGWFPYRLLLLRGWGLVGAGLFAMLLAQILGRRDLLTLGIFLLVLPLLAALGIKLLRPEFVVHREFSPASVETGTTTTAHLAITGGGFGSGRIRMSEQLPPRFGDPPSFTYPARYRTDGGVSRYEYRLRPSRRGQFRIGPVTAEFTDPFGLSGHRRELGVTELLTVTPAAVELPATSLTGARGDDGMTATRQRANPSDDDVMTRQYRHGDPMRRVHWPATARHGELMVRQEESVTTPEATVLLDSRLSAYRNAGHAPGGAFGSGAPDGSHADLISSETFEWTVVAAMSVAAHLIERSFDLQILDLGGQPGFHTSGSAPQPWEDSYEGGAGLASVAASLAALELTTPAGRRGGAPPSAAGPEAWAEPLLDKLSLRRQHGPLIALLGGLSYGEAAALAPAAEYSASAFAIVCTGQPLEAGELLEILRTGGWRAVAVGSGTPLASAWACFDEPELSGAANGPVRGGSLGPPHAGPRRGVPVSGVPVSGVPVSHGRFRFHNGSGGSRP
ncbi:DUF58 domain-containing protein [Paenarthrobacter sp. PH39-S1]|uniref:DUF58 domain-containing protein n=1 Tax=Paenarthrobacter sp. PH39-S1 TaxID=3046204 RepID=UPI0024B8A859|nr:DUF58 domain-containing protein [Paenarthrobacter sp. PH39-S1]MDJ0356143.1 DUF58 domain-containing protein [Paenarthrobacter sp. PH39-S1]